MTIAWTRTDIGTTTSAWSSWNAESVALSETVAGPDREAVVARLKNEMRGPMVAIEALRGTVARGGLSPEAEATMRGQIEALSRRVALMVEDLSLVYTWGRRRLVLELQVLNVAEQVDRLADLFPDLLVLVEASADVCVRADALRLQQLLANLVNSSQRGGNAPVCLYVTCPDSQVVLRMLGAPEGGYELDIVRQLVEAHGGRLEHDAAEGEIVVTLDRALPTTSLASA